VDEIPPESPVYNVKYVYIYDYTPEVVYVGYTPGYTCSYVYGGVVVYGTGYYYNPWYHSYYYPRPVTYGYSVHYNPWSGWGFSYGFSYGWFSYGWHAPYYGWWGPAGYHYGYRHGYYHGYNHGYNQGYYRGYQQGRQDGYVSAHNQGGKNIYNNRKSGVKTTGVQNLDRNPAGAGNRVSTTDNRAARDRNSAGNNMTRDQNRASIESKPSSRQNDVYAGADGNVYRRDQNGNVQERSNGQWNTSNRETSQQQINRESNSRQQGTQRYNQYNSTRSTAGAGRSAPARSGSGMRGR
jgi:hypothetical protein